jgi:hypothetical protein
MFWEQRDRFVTMKVRLCVVADVFVDVQELGQQSTGRHDSEHRGSTVVASIPVSRNRGVDDGVFSLV